MSDITSNNPEPPFNQSLSVMKKMMKFAFACILALGAASCATTTPVAATSNPVGNKCGIAKTTTVLSIFGGSADCGINKAAKNGGITRILHVDAFQKNYLGIVTIYGVRVYGE